MGTLVKEYGSPSYQWEQYGSTNLIMILNRIIPYRYYPRRGFPDHGRSICRSNSKSFIVVTTYGLVTIESRDVRIDIPKFDKLMNVTNCSAWIGLYICHISITTI